MSIKDTACKFFAARRQSLTCVPNYYGKDYTTDDIKEVIDCDLIDLMSARRQAKGWI